MGFWTRELFISLVFFILLIVKIKSIKEAGKITFKYSTRFNSVEIILGFISLISAIYLTGSFLISGTNTSDLVRPSLWIVPFCFIYDGIKGHCFAENGILTSTDFITWNDVTSFSWQGYSFKALLKGKLTTDNVEEEKKCVLVLHVKDELPRIVEKPVRRIRVPKDIKNQVEELLKKQLKQSV